MKIFILNPNFNKETKSIIGVRARQPLSLAIIASILRNDGHEIKFLDANVLNISFAQAIEAIKKYQPDVLILTSTPIDRWECPNSYINNVFKILNAAEVKFKILTGTHGTTMPEWVFMQCRVDYVIRGEPELSVRNLVAALDKGQPIEKIAGLSWQKDGSVVSNPPQRIFDLDSMPIPAYDLLPMDKYTAGDMPKPFSIVMASRGCPFNCVFCLKAMLPQNYVTRSILSVIGEIKYLVKNFGVKSIFFQDWEFFINEVRVKEICDEILGEKIAIVWAANSRATDIIRAKNLMPLIKRAGCFKINLGMESASDKVLKRINKQMTQKDLQAAVDILKQNGIATGYLVLLNAPGEDKNTIKETIDFIARNNLEVKKFLPVIPYPGTILFEKLQQKYPQKKFSWHNVEEFAGQIDTALDPRLSFIYLRHYKNIIKYGKFYFLRPIFWRDLIKRRLRVDVK